MLIRVILLSVYFLGRGWLDIISPSAALFIPCSAYQWNMLTLAGIACTGCTFLLLDRGIAWLQLASAQMGQSLGGSKDKSMPGQSWTRTPRTFCLVGPLLLGICQFSDFAPLWQQITLVWAKTPGCSQSLLSQLWFHHQSHFQRALLPGSVGGRFWMHSWEAFKQWGKLCAFPH